MFLGKAVTLLATPIAALALGAREHGAVKPPPGSAALKVGGKALMLAVVGTPFSVSEVTLPPAGTPLSFVRRALSVARSMVAVTGTPLSVSGMTLAAGRTPLSVAGSVLAAAGSLLSRTTSALAIASLTLSLAGTSLAVARMSLAPAHLRLSAGGRGLIRSLSAPARLSR